MRELPDHQSAAVAMSGSIELRVVATGPVAELAADPGGDRWLQECLARFMAQDWGDVVADDRVANDYDYHGGGRVLGAYDVPAAHVHLMPPGCVHPAVWIIGYRTPDGEAWQSPISMLWPTEY